MPEQQTRQRLLDTAGELFAQFGYHAVATRRIVKEANVNISAIPYYYNSKQGLYCEVLRIALEERNFLNPIARETVEQCLELGELDLTTVEERLRDAATRVYSMGLAAEKHSWPVALLLREFANPTGLLPEVAGRFQMPMVEALIKLFEALKPGASPEDAFQWAAMLLAPMSYCLCAQETITPFLAKGMTVESTLNNIADNVVDSMMNLLGTGLREV